MRRNTSDLRNPKRRRTLKKNLSPSHFSDPNEPEYFKLTPSPVKFITKELNFSYSKLSTFL